MAQMYKRIAESYQYQKTEDGISGQEVFIQDDANGTYAYASLPVVGSSTLLDPYGSVVGSCYCRGASSVFVDGDPNTLKWTFNYGTRKPTAEANPINNDPNNRRFRMGAENMTVEDAETSGYYWASGGSTDKVKQRLYRRIVVGEFTIPKSNLTSAQNATFIGSVQSNVGKINTTTMESFKPGQVYFSGIEGGTTYDNGELRYNYEMHFEYLINQHTGIGSLDYLYVPREDASGGWDIPKDKAGNYLFGSADLNALK